jgi:hypothetical protein
MIDGEKRSEGGRPPFVRPRRWPAVAGLAVVLSTGLAFGCGSSDSGSGTSSAPAKAADAPAASASAPSTTAAPASASTPTAAEKFEALQDRKGTMRLAALTLGVPGGGKLIVKPAGLVNETDHYYKPGTVVTLRPRATATARFSGWAGPCPTTTRPVCRVRMDGKVRVLAGFVPKSGEGGY